MTVIQLVAENRRISSEWSSLLPLNCPLEAADTFFATKMDGVPPLAVPITMRYRNIKIGDGISIQLEPVDVATERALNGYRAAVADATGVRRPDHDDYVFHVGLGYRTGVLEIHETDALAVMLEQAHETLSVEPPFVVAGPSLTFFDDMSAFATQRGSLASSRAVTSR